MLGSACHENVLILEKDKSWITKGIIISGRYVFHLVDVFTSTPFSGNQLAVLPEAHGLSAEGMQQIAREFNFSETAFVVPEADQGNSYRVRIFTPKRELDFAGHPTIGTACALVMKGHAGPGDSQTLILKENVGPVTVEVDKQHGIFRAMLTLLAHVEMPAHALTVTDLAHVLSLEPGAVKQVFFASVGTPFCFVHLTSKEAVDRAVLDKAIWKEKLSQQYASSVFFFSGDLTNGSSLYARMCDPAFGIEEDPATGSACAALVGAMAVKSSAAEGIYNLSIQQGVAMGRPSDIEAIARKKAGSVTSVSVGGATAYIASGEMEVPVSALAN